MAGQERPREDYFVGLDLGQAADYSACCVAARTRLPDPDRPGQLLSHYAVRHLKRWELRTAYPKIVSDVCDLVSRPPLAVSGCPWPTLAVDQTGVGAAVIDMLSAAGPRATLEPVLITGGFQVTNEDGCWHAPKKELVSVLQVLLQGRRLKVAPHPLREVLVREFSEFKVKVSLAGNETFESLRERDHDDLVLSVALACWVGEQRLPWGDAVARGVGDHDPERFLRQRVLGRFLPGLGGRL